MDCFVEGSNFLAIDPDGCIDWSACVSESPVAAIVNTAEATEAQKPSIEIKAQLTKNPQWKPIRCRKDPMQWHTEWATVLTKKHLLEGN